jgi:hypothetical protein
MGHQQYIVNGTVAFSRIRGVFRYHFLMPPMYVHEIRAHSWRFPQKRQRAFSRKPLQVMNLSPSRSKT